MCSSTNTYPCPTDWLTIATTTYPCPTDWLTIAYKIKPLHHTTDWQCAVLPIPIHVQLTDWQSLPLPIHVQLTDWQLLIKSNLCIKQLTDNVQFYQYLSMTNWLTDNRLYMCTLCVLYPHISLIDWSFTLLGLSRMKDLISISNS